MEKQQEFLVADLLDPDCEETLYKLQHKEKNNKKAQTQPKNLLHILLPTSGLELLPQTKQYSSISESPNFTVFKKEKATYKIIIKPKDGFNKESLTHTILDQQKYSKWNNNINQAEAKHNFPSQNLKVIYQKNKSFGTFWKPRDFVYLRHVFKYKGNLYIIDKSFFNQSYPPYVTTTRGDYLAIWGLLFNHEQPKLVLRLAINNEGSLNDKQQSDLTMAYINQFKNICSYAEKQKDVKLTKLGFDLEWDITQSEQVRQLQDRSGEKEWQDNDMPTDTHSQDDDIVEIKYDFNSQNEVIIPQDYLSCKAQLTPYQSKDKFAESSKGHFIWKDQWKRDEVKGGIVYINQLFLNKSRNVLKYILKKMGKNFISGKSILNISLPVNIFGRSSNLENLALGFCYAPIFVQKAVKQTNPIEQMKLIALYAITNPMCFITMKKPFNPILGQTFQGWINGCPVYVEQISHHPPIAAVYFVGRGYKISASLQSKAEISINSGTGSTDGVFKIIFDDGTDFNFVTPKGSVSGLAMGDRKLDFIQKSYIWSNKHCLYMELIYDPDKKGFFSLSKKTTTSDYFTGQILKIAPGFLKSFVKSQNKEPPSSEQYKKMSKLEGNWTSDIRIDEKVVFNINKDLPYKLESEKNLLPSDCSFREDVAYRRLRKLDIAQQQKEKLQNKQRNDAKLRKINKKH